MSYLSDKFNVSPETIKSMIRCGVISCKWSAYEEVVDLHRKGEHAEDIAVKLKMSRSSVYQIIKMSKI